MVVVLPENEEYKTWEEEMYWKHFHAMHFYVVLPEDFHDHLVLPSKFADHMSSKLPNKASLIGPSGSSWDVEVSKVGSLALVGDGWKDFVESFSLEENFLVMLKYTQNSTFEAIIFDQKSLCEKESTYFVKKRVSEPIHRSDRKRSVSEAASTELMEDNDDGSNSGVLSKKQKTGIAERGKTNNPEAPRTSPSGAIPGQSSEDKLKDPELLSDKATHDAIVEVVGLGKKNNQGLKSCVSNKAAGQGRGRPSQANKSRAQSSRKASDDTTIRELIELSEMEKSPTTNRERELFEKVIRTANNVFSDTLLSADEPDEDSTPALSRSRKPGRKKARPAKRVLPNSPRKFKSATKRLPKEYMSKRRSVTSEEKEDAYRRACEALPDGGFIVVMQPTCVYKRFYMNIPADWMQKNLPRQHHKVTLRMGEKTWDTMFYNYGKKGHSGGLGAGWKNFAIQNNLEESDVCVFKPASTTSTDDAALVLDVELFRVVPEITPLSPFMCSI